MSDAERRAFKALMRGVAVLMRIVSWQMMGRFDGIEGQRRRKKWAYELKAEATIMFEEAARL